MVKRHLLLGLFIILILSLTACNNDKYLKPDTPVNATILINQAISNNDVKGLNGIDALFTDGHAPTADEVDELRKGMTGGAELRTYGLIAYQNGEMYLVELAGLQDTYKGQSIAKVPEEMKKLFDRKK